MFTDLIHDHDVTEIMITAFDSIFFERKGVTFKYNNSFESEEHYQTFIQNLCTDCNLDLNIERPFIDSHWRGMRVHAVYRALTADAHIITLRKHRSDRWTMKQLMESEFSPKHLDTLAQLASQKRSILIVGISGCGKTSLLEACLDQVAEHERCAIIEDCEEIQTPNDISFKLLTQTYPNKIDQLELIRQSLRMRPDRIILGELRGNECKDYLMSLSTGHQGSMASMHARSPQEALLRLEMLTQLAAPHWSLGSIRKLILLAIDVIALVERDRGERKIRELYKPSSIEAAGITIDKLTDH